MRKLFSLALQVYICLLPVLFLTATAFSALSAVLAVLFALSLMCVVRFAVPTLVPQKAEKTVLFIAAVTGVSCMALVCRHFPGMPNEAALYMPLCIAAALLCFQKAKRNEDRKKEALSLLRLSIVFSVLLIAMGIIREFLGTGKLFSLSLTANFIPPMEAFSKPTGALIVAALVFALFSILGEERDGNE